MKLKYAIYPTNDNGSQNGPAVTVGYAEKTDGWVNDWRTAVLDGLSRLQNCAPEDVKDAGWHSARPFDEYLNERREKLGVLQREIEILENH